jgi:hypothetical protein
LESAETSDRHTSKHSLKDWYLCTSTRRERVSPPRLCASTRCVRVPPPQSCVEYSFCTSTSLRVLHEYEYRTSICVQVLQRVRVLVEGLYSSQLWTACTSKPVVVLLFGYAEEVQPYGTTARAALRRVAAAAAAELHNTAAGFEQKTQVRHQLRAYYCVLVVVVP